MPPFSGRSICLRQVATHLSDITRVVRHRGGVSKCVPSSPSIREENKMKTCALGLGLAAVVAATASADYSNIAIEDARWVSTTDFGGAAVDVYVVDIYMVSDDLWGGEPNSGDMLLNVFNWNTVGGASSYYQSLTNTGWLAQNAGGIFDAAALQEADSFVTIGGFGSDALQSPGAGQGSGLDPNFGGNSAAAPGVNAGWYNGSPPSYNGAAMTYDNGVDGTIIARFSSTAEFSMIGTTFEGTYNQGLGTPGIQGQFVVAPAPGAVALLGLAGVLGRRRRG